MIVRFSKTEGENNPGKKREKSGKKRERHGNQIVL